MVSFTNLQATWCMAYAGNQNLSFSLSTNNASSDVLKTFKEQRPSGGTMRLRKIVFISLKLIIHNLGPPGLRPLPHELLLHPQMWTRAIFYVKAGHSVDSFRKDWTQLEETFEELSSFWTALSKALDPEVLPSSSRTKLSLCQSQSLAIAFACAFSSLSKVLGDNGRRARQGVSCDGYLL